MSANNDSSANSSSTVNEKLVWQLNLSFVVGFLAYLALFAKIFGAAGQPLFILIVATAALNVGAVIGFLYSTFGEEEKKFSQIFVAVNGLLGGATLTDLLQKDNSLIIKCLEQITVGCGLDEKYAGSLFVVIITCVPVGFFWLYFNRKLVLNPEIYLASKCIKEANEVLNKKPLQIITDPDIEKPVSDPEVQAAAKVITKSGSIVKSGSVGALFNLGRSFYELHEYARAIPLFQKALEIRPNQPEVLLCTASAMLEIGNNLGAIGILEKLTTLSIVPTAAWKLLGYAYLFYPDDKPDKRGKLEKAITASRKFLAFEPNDNGAKLNLACAYGQLGPDYPGAVQSVISLIKEILDQDPGSKHRIRGLVTIEQDFGAWTEVSEFMRLLD
jgi:tetratricopeptide (TPR) repeat protein